MNNFDLTKILGSKCRTKILEKFFLEFESWNTELFHMRGLARELDEQINSIKRELDNLENLWLLKSKNENKKRFFWLNRRFFLIEEFKEIFLKSYNPIENIKNYLKNQKDLELIIINDSLVTRLLNNSNNIVDIFLIWKINKIDFNDFLAKTFFNRKIKYAIIEKHDFQNRIDYNDKLIINIFKQEWNIFLKDEINAKQIVENII